MRVVEKQDIRLWIKENVAQSKEESEITLRVRAHTSLPLLVELLTKKKETALLLPFLSLFTLKNKRKTAPMATDPCCPNAGDA